MPKHEQLDILVEGLSAEYESFISLLNNKSELFTFDEIESLLVAQRRGLNNSKPWTPPAHSILLTHIHKHLLCTMFNLIQPPSPPFNPLVATIFN